MEPSHLAHSSLGPVLRLLRFARLFKIIKFINCWRLWRDWEVSFRHFTCRPTGPAIHTRFDPINLSMQARSDVSYLSSRDHTHNIYPLEIRPFVESCRLPTPWQAAFAINYGAVALFKVGLKIIFASYWLSCLWGLSTQFATSPLEVVSQSTR